MDSSKRARDMRSLYKDTILHIPGIVPPIVFVRETSAPTSSNLHVGMEK